MRHLKRQLKQFWSAQRSTASSQKRQRQLIAVGIVLLIAYLGIGSGRLAWNNYQTRRYITSLETEIGQVQLENLRLSSEVEYMKTDRFKEKEARRLGFQLPGETVVLLPTPAPTIEEAPIAEPQKTPLEKWRGLLRI